MMKNNRKRRTIISILLALMLVAGSIPALAFAETEQEGAEDQISEELLEVGDSLNSVDEGLAFGEDIKTEEAESADEDSITEETGDPEAEEAVGTESEKTLSAMENSLKAASGEVQVSDNQTINVADYNTAQGRNPTTYVTELKYNSKSYSSYLTSTNYFQVPSRGTLLIVYKGAADATDYYATAYKDNVNYSKMYYPGSGGSDNYCCYMNGAGRIKMDFDCYVGSGKYGYVVFTAIFVPDAVNTLNVNTSGWTDYSHGCPGTGTSAFNVSVPGTGYLEILLYDETGYGNTVQFITNGFKDYEYLSTSNYRRAVGVTAGSYNITVKTSAPIYHIKARFIGVSENKFGAKKKKAAKIKKKKTINGIIATNNKRVHWYKIKLKKKQTIKLDFNTDLTGSSGGIMLTAYKGKKKIGVVKIRQDEKSNQYIIYRGTLFNRKKLTKGTYYLKLESYNGGNGYYSFKWK